MQLEAPSSKQTAPASHLQGAFVLHYTLRKPGYLQRPISNAVCVQHLMPFLHIIPKTPQHPLLCDDPETILFPHLDPILSTSFSLGCRYVQWFHRVREHDELKSSHKDHQVQLLSLHRPLQEPHHGPESSVQILEQSDLVQ